MIRLTIHSQSGPQIHLFKKDIITLGKESSGADLTISEEGLQPIFLNIVQQNGFPIIINLANDPFISLNGHPFGKKLLNHGDIILIRDTEILFENLNTPAEPTTHTDSSSPPLLNIELPFENEVDAFKDDEWHSSSIDQITLSSDDLPDTTKTYRIPVQPTIKETSHLPAKRWILFFIISILIIATVIGSETYRSLNIKSKEHEIMAARGVADIAMALTHAQLYHLKPGNQNWNDPDFFKCNLKAVLGDQPSYADCIDLHGNFTCCPYTLRTYTNQDLSRFLLIAQPEPDLFQWLIPKSIILVDSEMMELRALSDLRTLNRLLAHHHPLEDANGKEISRLFRESRLIALDDLCQANDHKDFSVPLGLNEIKSGCEHLIYNAPRFYTLSQTLIHKAKNLLNGAKSGRELTSLNHETETLSSLHYFTLYSKNGKSEAMLLKQSLDSFAPSAKFIIGFLEISPRGTITHSELLDDTPLKLDDHKNSETAQENAADPYFELIDQHHPVYIHLSALANSRQKGLLEKANEINLMFQQECKTPQRHFKPQMEIALENFLSVNSQFDEQIRKTLLGLSNQYRNFSVSEFLLFAKAVGFESLIHEETAHVPDAIAINKEKQFIAQINTSATFTELKNTLETLPTQLMLNETSDPELLAKHENDIRNSLLDRIQRLLLSSELSIPIDQISDEEYDNLKSVLNDEKFVHPHEKVYFLNELEYAKKSESELEGTESH